MTKFVRFGKGRPMLSKVLRPIRIGWFIVVVRKNCMSSLIWKRSSPFLPSSLFLPMAAMRLIMITP